MNFATLQGLTIPEGVVTQITDASGRVIWAVQSGKPAVLQVAKQTLTTYAGETTYTDEQFILLDIYPKTNGTVKVTYGGLTKTITDTSGAEEPNAQQVFFGTFNGVSDSVETPTSGELVIEGSFREFAVGEYQSEPASSGKSNTAYCGCITGVHEWGEITSIPANGFHSCAFTSFSVPEGIVGIKDDAFSECKNLINLTLPSTLETIGSGVAFSKMNHTVVLTINVLATTPPIWEDDGTGFMNLLYSGLSGHNIITVPKGRLDAYKAAAGWEEYARVPTEGNPMTVTMKEAS